MQNKNPGILCVFSHSVELQKANLEAQNSPSTGGSSQSSTAASPLASAIPLAQLLAKPGALNALTSLSALGGLTELLGGQAGAPLSRPPAFTAPTRVTPRVSVHQAVAVVFPKAPNSRVNETSLILINFFIHHT